MDTQNAVSFLFPFPPEASVEATKQNKTKQRAFKVLYFPNAKLTLPTGSP